MRSAVPTFISHPALVGVVIEQQLLIVGFIGRSGCVTNDKG